MKYNFPQDPTDIEGMLFILNEISSIFDGNEFTYQYGQYLVYSGSVGEYVRVELDGEVCNYHGPAFYNERNKFDSLEYAKFSFGIGFVSKEDWEKHPKVREANMANLIMEILKE